MTCSGFKCKVLGSLKLTYHLTNTYKSEYLEQIQSLFIETQGFSTCTRACLPVNDTEEQTKTTNIRFASASASDYDITIYALTTTKQMIVTASTAIINQKCLML